MNSNAHLFPGLSTDHLAQAHLNVDALVVESRIELVRILFASVVKAQTEIGVDSNAEIVVHNVDGGVILLAGRAWVH